MPRTLKDPGSVAPEPTADALCARQSVPVSFRSRPSRESAASGRDSAPAELSIVIPAYQESSRLGATLFEVGRFLRQRSIDGEVIVVDDGSTDGTANVAELAREHLLRLRVVRHARNLGKGAAVRTGVEAAGAPIVCFLDADLSTPVEELLHLIAAVRGGADIAIGSRHLPNSAILVPQPLLRQCLGALFRSVVRILLPLPFRDTQCGAKVFRAQTARRLASASVLDGYAFDLEWLALARRWQRRVDEVPVAWSDRPGSSLRILPTLFAILRDVLRVRRRMRG